MFACVGSQVTLCDPIWQVTLRSCEMDMVPYWYQTHEQLYGSLLLLMQCLLAEDDVCFDVDVVRLSEISDEVRRVRPSRFLHPDGIVRPFVYHDSEGNQILQVLVHSSRYLIICLSSFLCIFA